MNRFTTAIARRGVAAGLLLAAAVVATSSSVAFAQVKAPAESPAAGREASRRTEHSRQFLATIAPGAELQATLDAAVAEIGRKDPKFLASSPRIAAIELAPGREPRLAHVRGDVPIYPASVIKFVYLMAAYAWQERGRLRIDGVLDTELSSMIRVSSNEATQKVFARLTGTAPGPELPASEYAEFRRRRLAVKDWLGSLGIDDLHAVNPTYNGGGDLYGRDQQFLRDREVAGGLPSRGEQFPNRNAMTASGTARLLSLLAADLALTPADSETVRRRMHRDVREQPYLVHRIAGGAARVAKLTGADAFAKSGTWGPIYADAGIVRGSHGRQLAIAVFTEAQPPYRGDAIAELTERLALRLFVPSSSPQGGTS